MTTILLTLTLCSPTLAVSILFVTTNNGSLTALESGRKAQMEGWGHTVNTIWDGAAQGTFNTAFGNNACVYISDEVTATDLGYKCREAPIGIVSEHLALADDYGFCSSAATTTTSSTVNLPTNTHYITSVFSTGSFTLGSMSYPVNRMNGTTAPGGQVLATVSGANSIVAVENGATLANSYNGSSLAFGRRLQFPIQVSTVDGSTFSANLLTLAQRGINWVCGLDPRLVAHWKLDESSGTTASDSSGMGHPGTVTGTATWPTAVFSNGFQFNGSTKIQATGLLDKPQNLTLAAWANLTTADSSGADVISLGDHAMIRLDQSGTARAYIYNGTTWLSANYTFTAAGTGWHHYALVFNDATNFLYLFVDGVQAASLSTTASISYAGLGANTVIGANGNASTTYDFTGTIDDVRVYNYALTPSQVASLYGFVGWWNLSETSGTTAADSTVFAASGTLNGGQAWTAECAGYRVFDFDNNLNHFSINNASQLQPTNMLSIAGWIKGDSWGSGSSCDSILQKGDADPNNYQLAIADGRLGLFLDDVDTGGIRGNTLLTTGVWYHVAGTWDGTTVKIYVNGALDATPTARSGTIATDTRPLLMGGRPGADQFDGMMRDVRLYNRALLATEIQQMAGTAGIWKFNEGSGTTAADSSGLGNTATLSGGATWTSECTGINNALLTNGVGGIAQTATEVTPPSVGTVSFWIRSTGSPAATARIFGLGPDWEVRQNTDGTISFDLSGDATPEVITTYPINEVGRWYHIAETFDSSDDTYAIYIDGVLNKSGTNTNAMIQRPAGILSFGTRTGSPEYWSGAIRDFRIYGRKLCATEIEQLYGLAGHWKMDEVAGTNAADSSGLGNTAALTGTAIWTVGAVSGSHKFNYNDGDDYFTVPNSSSLQDIQEGDYSVSAWFKPLSTPPGSGSANDADYGIILKNGYHEGLYYTRSNTFRLDHWLTGNVGVSAETSSPTYSAGVFYHVAGVVNRTAGTTQLYVNGVLRQSASFTAGTAAREYNTNSWRIGIASPGAGTYKWAAHGIVDDARIYSRCLCPAEITRLYNNGTAQGVRIIKWFEVQ